MCKYSVTNVHGRPPCVYLTQREIYKYVEDSTVFEICTQNSVSTIHESVTVIEKWSKENDMKINASKTKEMIIRFGKGAESIPKISIDEYEIERVDHTKVLGVTLSSDLTWNLHIDGIVSKASKRLYMLYQLKRAGIRQEDLVRIYVSVIRPVVEYACPACMAY